MIVSAALADYAAMTGIGFQSLVLITIGSIHARDVSVKGSDRCETFEVSTMRWKFVLFRRRPWRSG